MKKLVLASSSPRRSEILKNLRVEFEVVASCFEEVINDNSPEETVCSLALGKAREVAARVDNNCIIIGADTIVYKDGRIFGKPGSEEEAFSMLADLSGCGHSVMTGLCIIDNSSGKTIQAFEETRVFFRKLSEWEIRSYIKNGEYADKAGGYGIQGLGALLVDKINGCYFNVVGLPVGLLYKMVGEVGINLLAGGDFNGK